MPDTPAARLGGSYLMPALDNATVADAMHPGVLTCAPEASLTEVARMMATHHVHCIVVMAPSPQPAGESRVVGMVTDLDLLAGGIQSGAEPTAGALVGDPMVSVERTTPLRTAADLMLERKSPHVLVTDHSGQRPVGVLSTIDIAGVLAWGEA